MYRQSGKRRHRREGGRDARARQRGLASRASSTGGRGTQEHQTRQRAMCAASPKSAPHALVRSALTMLPPPLVHAAPVPVAARLYHRLSYSECGSLCCPMRLLAAVSAAPPPRPPGLRLRGSSSKPSPQPLLGRWHRCLTKGRALVSALGEKSTWEGGALLTPWRVVKGDEGGWVEARN